MQCGLMVERHSHLFNVFHGAMLGWVVEEGLQGVSAAILYYKKLLPAILVCFQSCEKACRWTHLRFINTL